MRLVWWRPRSLAAAGPSLSSRRCFSPEPSRIRNLGIIAHIDAGKTTTTERMLFYAGRTRRMGDVDRGDTVTDYLPEERERGITITAAAITFPWRDHQFNLIDTPGHVDFGMEVQRSLRVLDGAVAILDGSAGVQAQTKTVWRQAAQYGVPRLIFVNKLDKAGANFERAVRDVREKLPDLVPLCLQLPIYDAAERIVGVEDLVARQSLLWRDPEGVQFEIAPWDPQHVAHHSRQQGRQSLLEQLAELDDEFLEVYLATAEAADPGTTTADIKKALRQLTVGGRIAPVLCGSAAKNVGVQPVLDSIVDFLPAPEQRPLPAFEGGLREGTLLALAFKVIWDEQRGPLVFVRIYSGILSPRSALRNATRGGRERATRIFTIFANQFEEIDEAGPGRVVVLLGLRTTRTGDTLTGDHGAFRGQLVGIAIPPPVFTCSVEPETNGDAARLEEALGIIEMEDPSVRILKDPQSGQRHLSGMGELHLEIVGKRITRDLRAKAVFGPIQISYKEMIADLPTGDGEDHVIRAEERMDREVMGKRMVAALRVALRLLSAGAQNCVISIQEAAMEGTEGGGASSGGMATTPFRATPPKSIEGLREAIQEGLEGALQEGPMAALPLLGLLVTVEAIGWSEGASSTDAFRYLAFTMLKRLLAGRVSRLAEPIMSVEITLPASHLGCILSDIHSTRRGHVIESLAAPGSESGDFIIYAEVPLASMLGYASVLRSKTGGLGNFAMQPLAYRTMSREGEERVLKSFGILREAGHDGGDSLASTD